MVKWQLCVFDALEIVLGLRFAKKCMRSASTWGSQTAQSHGCVLLHRYLFDDTLYRDRQSIGWGAFARVFKCQLPDFCQHEEPVALKVTDLSEVGEGHDSQVCCIAVAADLAASLVLDGMLFIAYQTRHSA